MAIKSIVYYPEAALKVPSDPVTDFDSDDFESLCTDLVDTVKHLGAHGLAAPQIGVNKRVFVLQNQDGEVHFFINPEIIDSEGQQSVREGCLSFPGAYEVITRSAELTVNTFDTNGERKTLCLDGIESQAFQHEMDHIDGVLFIDRVSAIKRRFMLKSFRNTMTKFSGR